MRARLLLVLGAALLLGGCQTLEDRPGADRAGVCRYLGPARCTAMLQRRQSEADRRWHALERRLETGRRDRDDVHRH